MRGIRAFIGALCLVFAITSCGPSATATAPSSEKYVVFVNVGEAIPKDVVQAAAQEACRQINVRFKITSLAAFKASELTGSPEKMGARIASDAALTIFLFNDEHAYGFISAPGNWAMVNMRSLKQDHPSAEIYGKRVTKMLMKGMAHAAGVGANIDVHCVMYYGSFSLAGIDATSASYGPNAYFPLMETLRQVGGENVFALAP